MKHRTHKDFPSYRFYSDGRIKNKTTNHFIKVKKHMKLIDAKGKRRSITVQKYFAELFPNLYSWQDGRGQSKPTYVPIKRRQCTKYSPEFIKAIQKEANKKTYDELIREYNIPMGSIGYLLGKGKSLGNGSIVINIDRVIIKG